MITQIDSQISIDTDAAEEEAMIAQMHADIQINKEINKRTQDAYDNDHDTTSPYDAMEQHKHLNKYDADFGNPLAGFEGAQISQLAQRKKRDAYDGDHDTVSPYDAMEHHHHLDKYDADFGNPLAGWEGAQISQLAQRSKNQKDAYDHDPATVSTYDDAEVHKHCDKYAKDYCEPNDLAQVHRK